MSSKTDETFSNRWDRWMHGFDWLDVCTSIEPYFVDKLVILDCCSAAISGIQAQASQLETLAACGWESTTSDQAALSFTRFLTDYLVKLDGKVDPL